MHTLQCHLSTTAYDGQVLLRRFRMLWHIHNQMVKHARKLLHVLERDREYRRLPSGYKELQKELNTCAARQKQTKVQRVQVKRIREQKDAASGRMAEIREELGLTKSGFDRYVKVMPARFASISPVSRHRRKQNASGQELRKPYSGTEGRWRSSGFPTYIPSPRNVRQTGSNTGRRKIWSSGTDWK